MQENKCLGGLDYFKLIAALFVIAIHTSPFASVNGDADFIFTRIIARMAVPFFLMTTGYFLLPQYIFDKSQNLKPLKKFIKKTLILYAVAIIIYFPINIYAGHFYGASMFDIVRMFIFDGTFYHLWYLPAVITGMILVLIMSRKLSFKIIFFISVVLYFIALFGDSYYGFISSNTILNSIYSVIFDISSYTRNGFFYVPVFLVLGAGINKKYKFENINVSILGFIVSIIIMIIEGFILNLLNVQKHDSMYIALLPCVFFLFQLALNINMHSVKTLRRISMVIYIIHPMVIIFLRGVAKFVHIEKIFIDNSIVHYISVCFLSCTFAVTMEMFFGKRQNNKFQRERAWIEISRENLHKNVYVLRNLIPRECSLMPAIKANGYGHGAVLIAKELNRMGIKAFCCASVSEGVELRRKGVKGKILILGYTHPKQFYLLKKYHLTQTVIDNYYARILNDYGRKIKVHIKIDTGMHRLGERPENDVLNIFKFKFLIVTGIYTHLCDAENKTFSKKQIETFYSTVEKIKKQGYSCGKVHLLSSYGLIQYSKFAGNYARVGIALYGVLSSRSHLDNCCIELYPILTLKARVAQVKLLYAGESAGYDLKYTTEQDRKIAVLTIGYADGIPRELSCGNGRVLVNGKTAPIIGLICMDMILADVTDVPNVKSGDIATIIGKDGDEEITVYELSEASGTITNELLSRLGSRLNRIM